MKKKKAPLPRKHSSLGNYYCNCLHTPPITEMNNKLSALTGSFPLPLPLSAAPYRRARGAARAAGRTPRSARAPAQGARGLFPRHRPRRAGKDPTDRAAPSGRAARGRFASGAPDQLSATVNKRCAICLGPPGSPRGVKGPSLGRRVCLEIGTLGVIYWI